MRMYAELSISCFAVDTSATESENETKALGIDPTTGKKIKGKKKKERDKLLKDKKNKKLSKKLQDKKDKLKQKQNKFQLNKKPPKFAPGRRPFKRNVSWESSLRNCRKRKWQKTSQRIVLKRCFNFLFPEQNRTATTHEFTVGAQRRSQGSLRLGKVRFVKFIFRACEKSCFGLCAEDASAIQHWCDYFQLASWVVWGSADKPVQFWCSGHFGITKIEWTIRTYTCYLHEKETSVVGHFSATLAGDGTSCCDKVEPDTVVQRVYKGRNLPLSIGWSVVCLSTGKKDTWESLANFCPFRPLMNASEAACVSARLVFCRCRTWTLVTSCGSSCVAFHRSVSPPRLVIFYGWLVSRLLYPEVVRLDSPQHTFSVCFRPPYPKGLCKFQKFPFHLKHRQLTHVTPWSNPFLQTCGLWRLLLQLCGRLGVCCILFGRHINERSRADLVVCQIWFQ